MLRGLRIYVAESWSELNKVAWPTRETVLRLTLIVIGVSIAIGIYLGVLDLGFRTVLEPVIA